MQSYYSKKLCNEWLFSLIKNGVWVLSDIYGFTEINNY